MRNTIFQQQANAATSHMLEEIKKDNAEIGNEIRASEAKLFSMFEQLPIKEAGQASYQQQPTAAPEPVAQSATSDAVQLEILKQLKELKEMSYSKKRPRGNQSTDDDTDDSGNRNGDGKGRKKKKKKNYRFNTSKYCWTCGAWNHHSKDCRV